MNFKDFTGGDINHVEPNCHEFGRSHRRRCISRRAGATSISNIRLSSIHGGDIDRVEPRCRGIWRSHQRRHKSCRAGMSQIFKIRSNNILGGDIDRVEPKDTANLQHEWNRQGENTNAACYLHAIYLPSDAIDLSNLKKVTQWTPQGVASTGPGWELRCVRRRDLVCVVCRVVKWTYMCVCYQSLQPLRRSHQ
jgi:hypothetical protein